MKKIKHDDPILKNPLLLLDPVNQAPAFLSEDPCGCTLEALFAGRVEAEEVTLRWNVQHGIIKPASTPQSSKRSLYERI